MEKEEAGPSDGKRRRVSSSFQGATLKVFVLEPTEVRVGMEDKTYGVTHVLAKSTDYNRLHELTMPEKLITSIQRATKKSILVKGYSLKEDGNIRLSDYSTVFDTFSDAITKEQKDRWLAPAQTPIAATKNMEKGNRVSIKGTVDKITQVLQGKISQRRVITVYDETGEVEIKLWGKRLMHIQPPKGAVITATCVTVDSYLNRTSLNSNMSTVVEISERDEEISGTIEAACFEENSLSVVINDSVYCITNQLMEVIFPLLTFEQNVKIEGQKRGNSITAITKVQGQGGNEDSS